MTNQLSAFEQLPKPIFGYILDQLNQTTDEEICEGIKKPIDHVKVPIVLKDIINLALTSKEMLANTNHYKVVNIFLTSLSNKYKKSPEYFAVLLNTLGTRQWLWKYVKDNNFDKSYQIVLDIYEVASDIFKEAKNAGLIYEYSIKELKLDCPFNSQTEQGFAFYNNMAPYHLFTPFGDMVMFNSNWNHKASYLASLSLSELFIKRLNAKFCGFLKQNRSEFDEVIIANSDGIRKITKEDLKEISREEAEGKKETQSLITNPYGGSYYEIREVKGKKIAEVKWSDLRSTSLPSFKYIKRIIWEMLEAHRRGEDPTAAIKDAKKLYPCVIY